MRGLCRVGENLLSSFNSVIVVTFLVPGNVTKFLIKSWLRSVKLCRIPEHDTRVARIALSARLNRDEVFQFVFDCL